MAHNRDLKVRNERIKFTAKTINWLGILCFVSATTGVVLMPEFSTISVVLLVGAAGALHLIAFTILGRLEKDV